MSARLQPAGAVSGSSGEVADHGVAFGPQANVGQVISGLLHSGWCDHSSVAPHGEQTTGTVDELTQGKALISPYDVIEVDLR